jgi:glutaredoxin
MAPNRRLKGVIGLIVMTVLVTIYVSTGASSTKDSLFYTRTQEAMAQGTIQQDILKDTTGPDTVHQRLRDAEDAAKKAATDKSADFHGEEVVRKGEQIKAELEALGGDSAQKVVPGAEKPQDRDAEKVEAELNYILKRSPGKWESHCSENLLTELIVVIFSKSYCPHSRDAKRILLENYTLDPAPYVVELDHHELGPQLQQRLGETTGRKTVPNVLVNGKSIGGGDDIVAFHHNHELISKIESLTGKRVKITANS